MRRYIEAASSGRPSSVEGFPNHFFSDSWVVGNGEADSDACYAPLEDRSVRHVRFEDVTLYELAD